MSHTVTLRGSVEIDGMEVGQFRARVSFGWQPALRGTWHDEPPHEAYGELHDVVQVEGEPLPATFLTAWAENWLSEQDDLHDALERDGLWADAGRERQELAMRAAAARAEARRIAAQTAEAA